MRFFAKIPQKNDPDSRKYINNKLLKKLNNIKFQVENYSGIDFNSRQCAVKVIDCLRFIAINKNFIQYAINNPRDKNIYTYATDMEKGVIRDFNLTSMHFNSYEGASTCMGHLTNCIVQFEGCVSFCIDQGDKVFAKMISKMAYDEDVGCLEARLQPLFDYVQQLQEYSNINTIDDLFLEYVSQKLSNVEDDKKAFEICYKFLCCKIGLPCIIGGTVKKLTLDDLNAQMSLLGFTIPENLTPEIAKQLQYSVITNTKKSLNSAQNQIKSIDKLIKSGAAVIKIMRMTKGDTITFESIRFLVEQLANTETYRPLYPVKNQVNLGKPGWNVNRETLMINGQSCVDRNLIYNPRTGQFTTRAASTKRGLPSSAKKYTKKTSVTWIPKNGKTALFGNKFDNIRGWSSVGLIFDEQLCHQKDLKYISIANQATNRKSWVGVSAALVSRASITTSTLFHYTTRDDVAKSNLLNINNERLYGLSTHALTGVVSIGREREQRLTALIVHQYLQAQLGESLDLQLYEIDTRLHDKIVALSLHQYSDCQIWEDVLQILLTPHDIYQKKLGSAVDLCKLPVFDPSYFQELLIRNIHRKYSSNFTNEYILALQFILAKNYRDLEAIIVKNPDFVLFIKYSDIRQFLPSLLDIAIRVGNYAIADLLADKKIYCEEFGIAVEGLIDYQQYNAIEVLNKLYSSGKIYTDPLQQYIHIHKKNIVTAIIERDYIFLRYYFKNCKSAEIVTVLQSWHEIHLTWGKQDYLPDTDYLENLLLDTIKNELIDYNFCDEITGKTALHLAFTNEQYSIVKMLLYKKANPFFLNNFGEMPFTQIINLFNHNDVTALLLPLIKHYADFIAGSNAIKQELSCAIHEYMNKQNTSSPECYKILYECITLKLIDIATPLQQENSWLKIAIDSSDLNWHDIISKHRITLLSINITTMHYKENSDLKKTIFDTICLLDLNDMKLIGIDATIKILNIAMSFLVEECATYNLDDNIMSQIRMIITHLLTISCHENVADILKTHKLLHPTKFSIPLINILAHCSNEQWYLIHFLRYLIITEYEYEGTVYVDYVSQRTQKTPLHIALECHNYEIAKTLLHNRANIAKCDANGITPFILLVTLENRNETLIKIMSERLSERAVEEALSDDEQAKKIITSANMQDSNGHTFIEKLRFYNCNRLADNLLKKTNQLTTGFSNTDNLNNISSISSLRIRQ